MERLSCFKTLDCWRWTPFWSAPSATGVIAKSKDKYPCLFLSGQQIWKNKKEPWDIGVLLPLYPASNEMFGLVIHWLRTSKSNRVHRRTLWSTCFSKEWYKWSEDSAVVRALASHQCGPCSIPGLDAICGFSLLLVLSLCTERFFSRYSGFPLSLKTNTSIFQFDLERTDTYQRALIRTSKCSVGKQITNTNT